jgi:hypothetical protein
MNLNVLIPRIAQNVLPGLLFLIICPLLFFSCSKKAPESPAAVRSFEKLKTLFSDPPAEFRSAPLWVWNDEMTEDEIDTQLADFKEKGIGGVFVHPRPGLITPYLSDRWNTLFRHTTEKARSLGMDVWIYDENSYPSGFAGGHVPADMPESYNQGVGLIMTTAEVFPQKLDRPYLVILRKEKDDFVDITADSLAESGKKGSYMFFAKGYYEKAPWYGGYSYVDVLREGVTEKFLDITMRRGYETVSREEFGKTVRGIFTDEPHVSFGEGIKWTPDLFARFQQRWGYDLRPNLPSLWGDVGDWRRVRHNYYETILDLFIDRWSKPYHDYCERNKLAWTGHYWEHAWPNPVMGPDNMAMYAWHHMPGVDVLMNQYSEKTDAQFGNVRSAKELSSAANQMGHPRTMSETYGAAGWALRFEDMKRIADWQYVLGINFVNQHLSYVTIKGARKRDHPQSFSYHEPWWHLYRSMGDYFGRMSLALSSGDQINKILVLEPTTTAWSLYAQRGDRNGFAGFGQAFQDFVTDLEKRQIEYDLGSEKIIEQVGSIDNDKFVIGHRSYDLVVLPSQMENVNKATADMMEQYVKNGGKVLAFGNPPSFVDGTANGSVATLAAQWPERWIRADSVADRKALDLLSPKDFVVNNLPAVGGLLYHHRRKLDDGQLLLLTNTSLERWSAGTLQVHGTSALTLNAMDGSIKAYPSMANGGMLTLAFNLPPAGALLLYVGENSGQPRYDAEPPRELSPVSTDAPITVQRTSPNTLILDYCDLTLPNKNIIKDLYFYAAADTIFKTFGLAGNPWSRAVQYKSDILDRNHFPQGSGFEATFHLTVGKGVDRAGLRAVVERPSLWQLLVNGTPVQPLSGEYWLDQAFGVYEIGKYVIEGNNALTLASPQMTIHSELEPLYILGDFGLESQARGWKLTKGSVISPGPWNKQGMPMYPSGVAYTTAYRLEKNGDRYLVRLPQWSGTVAEVRVNGKHAGIIGWQPYEADITEAIQQGMNEVTVIVYGSLKNLLGPLHNHPPAGAAWPTQFEAGPLRQPSGAEYDNVSYGLSGEFQLLRGAKLSGTMLAGVSRQ